MSKLVFISLYFLVMSFSFTALSLYWRGVGDGTKSCVANFISTLMASAGIFSLMLDYFYY